MMILSKNVTDDEDRNQVDKEDILTKVEEIDQKIKQSKQNIQSNLKEELKMVLQGSKQHDKRLGCIEQQMGQMFEMVKKLAEDKEERLEMI